MPLPVLRWGEGKTKTALLLHGIASNKEGWWRVGPALAEIGYEVIAPDMRGHGVNSLPDSMGLAEFASDVFDTVVSADLVLAHSLGASVAITMLDQRPDFCDLLILEDPALMLNNSETTIGWLTAEFDREVEITAETVMVGSPTWHGTDALHKASALNQLGHEGVLKTLNSNPDINLMEEMARIGQPTLLLGAEPAQIALIPPALGEGIVALNPNVEFHTVPNASHSIHRDAFEPMMATVADWLVRNPHSSN